MITICLATYNGEKYLKEQIESLLSQTYQKFHILAIDDCSTDSTVDILKTYNIQVIQREKNFGANNSFSTLLEYALNTTDSNYFMFCDQDDIWENTKIEKEYALMKSKEVLHPDTPILIHTDLTVVNVKLEEIHHSFIKYQNLNPKLTQLNNVLIQNSITGCTTIINKKLALLSTPIPKEAIMHDWWIAIVASTFGEIFFLPESTIKYRQHNSNDIGATRFNLFYILNKIYNSDKLEKNIIQTTAFLIKYKELLKTKDIELLECFISLKKSGFIQKRISIFKYQFYKNGLIRNIGLLLTL